MFDACNKMQSLLADLRVTGRKIEYNRSRCQTQSEDSDLYDKENELFSKILDQQRLISNVALNYISFADYKMCGR